MQTLLSLIFNPFVCVCVSPVGLDCAGSVPKARNAVWGQAQLEMSDDLVHSLQQAGSIVRRDWPSSAPGKGAEQPTADFYRL